MEEENKIDYKKLGCKSGLEIHQQLDGNGKKLFCKCPSVLRSESPDYNVYRRLHAIAGETGKVDVAAEHEAKMNKEFVYEGYHDNVCLVDLDEEPPKEINKEVLKVALHVALLLNCKIIPVSQIMRKTVLDGSNTSGFQRTVLIAKDGFVETSKGKVGIDHVFLEEDAARIITKDDERVVYRLDRLGIPLVEIATKPDIVDAEHAKETALKIGSILRSCSVKRGIGTIRQDINISIKGSNRVELKGFQDPKIMTKTVDNEIERQLEFVEDKKKNPSEVRKVLPTGKSKFMRPMPSAARMYPETDLPLLKISRDMINEAKKTLPKLREEIEEELKEKGLNKEMIKLLLKQKRVDEFKELLGVYDSPDLVVKTLMIYPKDIATRENKSLEEVEEILNRDVLVFVLEKVAEKKVSEKQVKDVLDRIVKGEKLEKAIKFEKADDNKVEEFVMKVVKEKPDLNPNAYMGLVMKEFKGKVSGKEVMEIIQKHIK